MIRLVIIFSILSSILYLIFKYPSLAIVVTLANIWLIYHLNRKDIESLAKNQKVLRDGIIGDLKVIKKEIERLRK